MGFWQDAANMLTGLTDNDYKKNYCLSIDNNFYWILSPTADGNCGLYAFACGLIDAITRHELILDPDLFDKFSKKLLEDLPSCALEKLLKKPSVNFNQFKNFLLQQPSRETLCTLAFLFSTSLRKIGYDNYFELLKKEAQVIDLLEEDDKKLNQNGKYIGFEMLIALASYFEIEISLIAYNPNTSRYYWAHSPLSQSKPLFILFNLKSHWNYLLPKEQTNGLAKFFQEEIDSPPKTSVSLLKKTSQQLKKNMVRLLAKVKIVTQNLKKTFKPDEIINSDRKKLICSDEAICLDSSDQIDESIADSIETLRTYSDSEQLDVILEVLDLTEIEKDLIIKAYVMDEKTDETAVMLQNQTLFDFFKRNYSLLAKRKSSSCISLFFGRSSSEISEVLSTTSKLHNR